MEVINLKNLADTFSIHTEECYKILLKFGNDNGLKLLAKRGSEIVIPAELYNEVLSTQNSIEESLTDLDYITGYKNKHIPFDLGGYVYYLFSGKDLVYIGQSNNIALRVSTHKTNGVNFDAVYCERVDNDLLLIKERFYIYRDFPEMNKLIMTEAQYLKEVLNLISLSNLEY